MVHWQTSLTQPILGFCTRTANICAWNCVFPFQLKSLIAILSKCPKWKPTACTSSISHQTPSAIGGMFTHPAKNILYSSINPTYQVRH